MDKNSRPLPYTVLSYDRIESLSVGERLQLMDDLWNSIFFGRGRKAGRVWFPLRTAILHEFQRRFPDDIEIVATRGD